MIGIAQIYSKNCVVLFNFFRETHLRDLVLKMRVILEVAIDEDCIENKIVDTMILSIQ